MNPSQNMIVVRSVAPMDLAEPVTSEAEEHLVTPSWRPGSKHTSYQDTKENLQCATTPLFNSDAPSNVEGEDLEARALLCPGIFLPDASLSTPCGDFKLTPRISKRAHRDLLELCRPMSKRIRNDAPFAPLDFVLPVPLERNIAAAEGNNEIGPFRRQESIARRGARQPLQERLSRPQAIRPSRGAHQDSAPPDLAKLFSSKSSAFSAR